MSENNEARIQGGYILLARTLIDNPDVFQNCPPIRTKLWLWMLMEAFWRDGEMLKRGQLITSIDEMREAMSYKVGYRLETPTRDEIRSAYGAFARAGMIEVQKTMRGMVISVVNYETYQSISSYKNLPYENPHEAHNNPTTNPITNPTTNPTQAEAENPHEYSDFSDQANSEPHSENRDETRDENIAKPTTTPHHRERKIENRKEEKKREQYNVIKTYNKIKIKIDI